MSQAHDLCEAEMKHWHGYVGVLEFLVQTSRAATLQSTRKGSIAEASESCHRSGAISVPGKLGEASLGSRLRDDYLVLLKLLEHWSEVIMMIVAREVRVCRVLNRMAYRPCKFDFYGSLLYLRRYSRAHTGSGPKSQQTFVL